jgi:hypothetical protein
MKNAATERGDRALRQWVRAGRTLVEVGDEFAYLRRECGRPAESARWGQHELPADGHLVTLRARHGCIRMSPSSSGTSGMRLGGAQPRVQGHAEGTVGAAVIHRNAPAGRVVV